MNLVDAAIQYLRQGFSSIPMSPTDKRPLVKWSQYQDRLPSENEIQEMFSRHPKAMCGLITGKNSGLAVVDCDSSEACEKIDSILPETFETPIAMSPRGGRHYYFRCPESLQTRAGVLPKVDVRANGGLIVCPPSQNFQGKQYRWVNGLELSREALQEMPASLLCTLKGALNNNTNTLYSEKTDRVGVCVTESSPLFSVGRRDTDLFTLANSLVKSGMSEADIFKYLDFIMRAWGENDETWINAKIASALKRKNEREKSLFEEIEAWISVTERDFCVTECDRDLGIVTKRDKVNRRQIFKRLLDRGVIEKVGMREGGYRRMLRDYEPIDLAGVSIKPLNIKWPFDIHEKVYMLPKSVAVIAGQTDAGKTAFCLNLAYLNRNQNKVRYLTSEMGAQEIKSRILSLGQPLSEWQKIQFIERSSQFQDLILPDGVTIIDYLEKSENFYEIAKDIKNIFDRLKSGFCLIALQKKEDRDFGRGGDFSAEKARLYLSMSPGKLKITKAKNWAKMDANPNRLECAFKLVNGIKFVQTSGWMRPD
ncbi:MAG: hypothetical protein CV087_02345 [Candidatus Brocadia sp. WS118]|nr:MAG: hypothetical protein CV087_02345 [Candidatus Brocadia sp. WS118]